MPGLINKRFTKYEQIAGKKIDEIFAEDELTSAKKCLVNQFASVYLENQQGQFTVHSLPLLAQSSKLFAICITDINQDNKPDIIAGGNLYGVSMYQGRYDGNNGLILMNSGKSPQHKAFSFNCLSSIESGFVLSGEVRDIKAINTKHGKLWLIARNNAPLQIFTQTKSSIVKKN